MKAILVRIWLLPAFAALAVCCGDGGNGRSDVFEPLFQEEFEDILDNLVADFWSEDGDWDHDMQGDATAFAPMVLYPLARERSDPELARMATTTADHELGLVLSSLASGELGMDVVIGAPALAEAYRHTGDTTYLDIFLAGVTAGHDMMITEPERFLPYVFDLVTVYGTGSFMCFTAWELSGQGTYRDMGIELIELAEEEWDEQAGLYEWSRVIDWPQATMMMALVAAYRATGENAWRDRAVRVLQSMDACCLDPERGGYYGHLGLDGKGLSGNNNMAWALLDLAEATGDTACLEQAADVLRWILSDDLYDADKAIIYHHWMADFADDPGRAETFCTGCNFHALVNIHRFNRLGATLVQD